ncbi:MAG: hypothetical protein HUK06_03910 [Bacteroidaceae bacterium]|nr:hypothetical protein [Bacteroidaceae bacterium]
MKVLRLMLGIVCCSLLFACSDNLDEPEEPVVVPELTIFLHQPYGIDVGYLNGDLSEIDAAMKKHSELRKVNILYFRSNTISGSLYKKYYDKDAQGQVVIRDSLLKSYPFSSVDYTTYSGLKTILSDVISIGKTEKIGMVIGCHSNGWLPTLEDKSSRAFGTTRQDKYDTTFKTLSKAIESLGKKFEFVLTDCCLCQNIEVAYDMRNTCKYLIGSVTEIGSSGQNYEKLIYRLYKEDYAGTCDDSYETYYKVTSWNSATLSVVDCSQVDNMAAVMKRIYKTSKDVERTELQVFDGYDYASNFGYNVFYDFAEYVSKSCTESSLLADFNAVMSKLVTKNVYTPTYNSAFFPPQLSGTGRKIRTCCGLSCSDPCTDRYDSLKETNWYKATH